MVRSACVALPCAIAAGCLSTTGLTGGQPDAAPADAAWSDAADATLETSSPPADDGRADAPPGDATPLAWCKNRQGDTLCDDFDEAPLGQLWTTTSNADDAGVLVIDTDASVSPPKSLFLYSGGSVGDGVGLTKILTSASKIHCEFDLRVELTGGAPSDVFTLTVNAPGFSSYVLALSVSNVSSSFTELAQFPDAASNYSNPHVFGLIAPGQWTPVSILLSLPGQATVVVNGTTVVSVPLFSPTNQTSEQVAILANAAIASVAVRFDNVACQASP